MEFRVGQGIDIHPFATGRKLILGGIEFPGELGLAGHSDADALLHAITDAVLGAAGLGDIGQLFPDTDRRWKDADSSIFLKEACTRAKQLGWQVVNVDCTLLLEAPRLSPQREKIRENIANLLELDPGAVGVKATTTEQLGFVGRREGLLASCVIMLKR